MRHQNHLHPREHQRALTLVREYSRKGYEVILYPAEADLPSALSHCPPTLVAHRHDEVVAVEVRTPDTLTLNGNKDLRLMAKQIQQLPGWDFELVVTSPRRRAS